MVILEPSATDPPRRFAIGDLMIIVAGTALGCAWTRSNWQTLGPSVALPTRDTWRATYQTLTQLPTPLLFSLGIAALVCRFNPPRPPIAQVAQQPGIVALAILSFVMTVNAAIVFAGFILELFFSDRAPEEVLAKSAFLLPDASELFMYQVIAAGPSVAICWSIQKLTGRWRPEHSWIDRTGRLLGASLMAINLFWLLEWTSRPF